jgi:hypothetical protein
MAPFSLRIVDGIFECDVVAVSEKDALLIIADYLPVVKFL